MDNINRSWYLVLLLLALQLNSCGQSVKRTPLVPPKPKREYGGIVKKIVEYDCDKYFANEQPLKIVRSSCKISEVFEFNLDEIRTKHLWWGFFEYPNDPQFIDISVVGESGQILEKTSTATAGGFFKAFNNKETYSYNAAGFITEWAWFRDNHLDRRLETKYDEFNCPIRKSTFDAENNLVEYTILEYNEHNLPISSTNYDRLDRLVEKQTFEYDFKDSCVITSTFDANGTLTMEEDECASRKNNVVDAISTNGLPGKGFTDIENYPNGQTKTWRYTNEEGKKIEQKYDLNGRIILRTISSNAKTEESFEWKYQQDGKLIEESTTSFISPGKPYYKKSTFYRLDYYGNWVEKYSMDSEFGVIEMFVREIEYY